MSDGDRGYLRFNLTVGILLGAFAASLFLLMAYMEPVTGNLTRKGGYLENDYGWNAPQQVFPEPLFEFGASVDDYDRHFDVIVVGDSFSNNGVSGWQNYLVDRTGLSLLTFNGFYGAARVSIYEILESAAFQATPPALFIYESIERNLLARHSTCDDDGIAGAASPAPPPLDLRPHQSHIERVDRSERPPYPGASRFDTAINYARKATMRNLLKIDRTEVRKFELSRSDLFSNRRSGEMLILTRDYKLLGASEEEVTTVGCSLRQLQERVQSNGRTVFVALLFPDKTTAYSDYIVDDDYTPMTILSRVERYEDLTTARLSESIPRAIGGGGVDVYLPDDEHCGYLGYSTAAESLIDVLTEIGSIREL